MVKLKSLWIVVLVCLCATGASAQTNEAGITWEAPEVPDNAALLYYKAFLMMTHNRTSSARAWKNAAWCSDVESRSYGR